MSTDELIARSERARSRGLFDVAENLCRKGLVQLPSHGVLLFESAATSYAASQTRMALQRFQRVAALLPRISAVHFNIGVCARAAGEHDWACQALRKALVLDPNASGALDSLAQSQSTLGHSAIALVLASRQLLLHPSSPKAWATRGFIAWEAERLGLALVSLKTALILEPGALDVDMNLTNALLQSGLNETALERFRRLARLSPRDPAVWLNLGVALITANDWHGASNAYARLVRLRRGGPVSLSGPDPFPDLPKVTRSAPLNRTAWHALKFAEQQLTYLLDRKRIPADYEDEATAYQEIMGGLDEERRHAISFELTEAEMGKVSRYHDRLVHLAPTGWKVDARPALNPQVDWETIETTYHEGTPALAVVDNFLDPLALSALRRFCLESTIWFEMKGAGYLGAYFRDGFNDPLLLAIAEQLTARMPHIFANHPLRMIWAYTYEQSMVGINPHADFARINVNFWITPDEANLDPETGGLLIYRRPAPESWGFEQYNAAPGEEIMKFLGDDAHTPIRVPHRQNRAVIFDSRLFHETDRLTFREGIENRRINITMLFGEH